MGKILVSGKRLNVGVIHREFLVIPKVGKKNRKFVGFSWVLVLISQIGKMLPKPILGSSKPNKNPQIGILVYQL